MPRRYASSPTSKHVALCVRAPTDRRSTPVEAISADSEKEERSGLFLYTVTIRTEKTYLGETESDQPVIPGMQTTVDIVSGKRTILAFLTDRLRQTAATAFNQR